MRRALPFLLLVLIALAGCGDKDARAPFTDSRIPPGLEHRFYPPQGWAWGLIQVGKAPPVRYGVAGPGRQPVGQIIILPGVDETAEAWFETVRDLVARGYVVWVLEGSGQGGSGRSALPRDLVHAESLDPDVAAVMVLAAKVARDRPRFLIAAGASTPVAARAAELGLQLDGLVLVDPRVGMPMQPDADEGRLTRAMRLSGLGATRVPGGRGWRRPTPGGERLDSPSEDRLRAALTLRWQGANPDLRMGDPSIAWAHAYRNELEAANAGWPKVRTRTLAIGPDVCRQHTRCAAVPDGSDDPTAGLAALHRAFIGQLLRFIDPKAAALAPPPPPATLDPDA